MNWMRAIYRLFGTLQLLLLALAVVFSVWLWASEVDATIFWWCMHNLKGRWQDFFSILSTMGQGGMQMLFVLVVSCFYYWRADFYRARAWFLSFPAFLLVGLSGYPLKVLFGRPRPKMLAGHDMYAPEWFELQARFHAYPSGHTITTFCLLATVEHLFAPRWRPVLWVAAIIISAGRVGIGSHYAGDVVLGAAIGYFGGQLLRHYWKLDQDHERI